MLKDILTKKEFEVLAHLAEGYRAQEIANHLGMAKKSVDEHLRRIYEKLAIPQRGEGGQQAITAAIIFRKEYPNTPLWYENDPTYLHTPRKALPKSRNSTNASPKSA